MTAPKPSAHTAAQLRVLFGANPCQNPGHADPPCTWNQRAAQLDDLLAAARAEAVAPVMAVLRSLVEAMPRCVGIDCARPATRYTTGGDSIAWCDDHGCDPPLKHDDAEYAAPLRLALALLAADQSDAKAGKP